MKSSKSEIPGPTIRRLPRYCRGLEEMAETGESVVTSAQLAAKCMVDHNQLRQDLFLFGQFGSPGIGYPVRELLYEIKVILGLDKEWRMAVIGIGSLGSSLLAYNDFLKKNYRIVAAFDIDPPNVIGRVSENMGKPIEVFPINWIKDVAMVRKIEIGLITTPASEAQNVANMLVKAKVRGIVNFTASEISVPKGYVVKDVYVFFTTILDNLAFLLLNS